MKKGFTLIELLSVIIIIAVITLIAVPVVSGIITKVKLGALKSSAYGLLEASDLYYARYNNTSSLRFDIDENVVSSNDTTNLLSYKGKIKEGTVIINKKGETTICITDGTNSVYKNFSDKHVIEAANKKCNIPSSTYVVYLDNQATLSELSNQELTELVRQLQEQMDSKADKSELETTNSNLETVATVASSATLDKTYPVGSIYVSVNSTSPATLFGGTWERITGKFLLSATDGGSSGALQAAGNTGGSATINLQHSHSMQSHTHTLSGGYALIGRSSDTYMDIVWSNPSGLPSFTGSRRMNTNSSVTGGSYTAIDTVGLGGSTGGPSPANTDSKLSTTQSIMPPYLSVYVWKRTA